MKKKIIVLVLVLIFAVSGIASAYPVPSDPWTEGNSGWVQGWSDAWDNGAYEIFLEVRTYEVGYSRIGIGSNTNTSHVTAHTSIVYGYNIDVCVSFSSAWTL